MGKCSANIAERVGLACMTVTPGLEECIVYDHKTNPDVMFEEETSGFDQHPADVADDGNIFFE